MTVLVGVSAVCTATHSYALRELKQAQALGVQVIDEDSWLELIGKA